VQNILTTCANEKIEKKVDVGVLCTSKFSRVQQNFSGLKVHIIDAPSFRITHPIMLVFFFVFFGGVGDFEG
jgi:hypothetical protein